MQMEVVLSIVGFFGICALGINGYFLKGIFSDLGTVKIKLAEISARGEAKENRLDKLEVNEKEIFERLNIVEREVLK